MRRVALCCFVKLRSAVVPMAVSIQELQESIRKFRDERDWLQFHNHKDMATALAIEAAELQELFLWKHGSEVEEVASTKRERLSEELADVAVYLLELADNLGIDLGEAVAAMPALARMSSLGCRRSRATPLMPHLPTQRGLRARRLH